MHEDVTGRPYAKLSELKIGDIVELDGGFTCNPPHVTRQVQRNAKTGELFIRCTGSKDWRDKLRCKEQHTLDGQADDGVHCVGVYKV